jgi:uncharacterized protein
VGVLLIVIPTLLLFQKKIEERVANRPPTAKSFMGMALIGLVAGFLVGMTSVGSGSVIMMLLLLFYSLPPKVNVGTDIVHAVVLTGVTGLFHFRLGNVDPGLVMSLLIGSIPGGLAGSHLATRVPMLWLRQLLCALLLISPHVVGVIATNTIQEKMSSSSYSDILIRIEAALDAAHTVFAALHRARLRPNTRSGTIR